MPYVVAVRTLCEFTAKAGDLDMRFTPSASALEGMAGHAMVTSRRAGAYQTEVTLSGEFGGLLVRGRADGYDPDLNLVEEIKTYRGNLEAMPANRRALHWAQARVYGWLLCQKLGLADVRVSLVYYDVASQLETVLVESQPAAALQAHFEQHCKRFVEWAEQEAARSLRRDDSLRSLRFPHDGFRPGQRMMSEAVYKAASAGRCLVAQAPTGIGKTVGALFPLLKAWPEQQLDKIVYLTAKSPGRALALHTVRVIGGPAQGQPQASALADVRVLELVAKQKACEHPGKACNGDACPLAKGFYDRLPTARADAVTTSLNDAAAVREVALKHRVCPYYLTQELIRWSDVIVGDYNYWFDASAMLHGMAAAGRWKVSLLVDEAHNLVERARGMYSAELSRMALGDVLAVAPPRLRAGFKRLQKAWLDAEDLQRASGIQYEVLDEMPAPVLRSLQSSIVETADYLGEQTGGDALGPGSALLSWHFDALRLARLLDSLAAHSLLELSLAESGSAFCVRNVVPAPFLTPRFAAAQSAALFSATLDPPRYYADMLGLPENALRIDVPSPFAAEQLRVELVGGVSTRFPDRADSLLPIVGIMAKQFSELPGNYLAFFSSFDYLSQTAALLATLHRDIPIWQQSPQMSETARTNFVQRFTEGGRGIGFAVLGGAFGEGIDLPGSRLIGAFIATLGLPPANAVNEQIRARMQAVFGAGHDYTYLYPGIQKVVQAAGRVIRGPDDRGVVFLIDDRFTQSRVRALLPAWWRPHAAKRHHDIAILQ